MKAKIEINDQTLTDIVNAAMRWSWWAGYGVDREGAFVIEFDEDAYDEDVEDSGETVHRLNWDKGLALAFKDYGRHLAAFDTYCADNCDVLVQLAAFGEVKYG